MESISQSNILQDVLNEIESLRKKRQSEYVNTQHPEMKRFSQQELTDEVFPTYKNLLIGRSSRIPNRETLLRIAEYLECNYEERNRLLLSGKYLPIFEENVSEKEYQARIDRAKLIVKNLPFPSIVISQQLKVFEMNSSYHFQFDIPEKILEQKDISLVDLHFSSEFNIRERSTFNKEALKSWENHAIEGIQKLKQRSLIYQEGDLLEIVREKYEGLYDVRYYYKQAENFVENKNWNESETRISLFKTDLSGTLVPVRYQEVRTSFGNNMYPEIISYVPIN